MEQQESPIEAKRFGRYLRRVREGRRLSLDAVEELSSGYTERVTKSHLSRIENGLAEPSFRKMFALSQIYGMPLTVLAERLELDLQQEVMQPGTIPALDEDVSAEADRLMLMGRHSEALVLLVSAIDARSPGSNPKTVGSAIDSWTIKAVSCLIRLERYELAKLEAERLLSRELGPDHHLYTLQLFVLACFKLGRFSMARMGIDSATPQLDEPGVSPRHKADFAALRAALLADTGNAAGAVPAYRRALELYEEIPNRFEAYRTRINMAAAMIETSRFSEAREQLEASLLYADSGGYERLHALAMSHMTKLAYLQDELDACETWAIRSNTIARARDFNSLVFRNCYYLWKVAARKSDSAGVRLNERTLRTLVVKVGTLMPEAEDFRATTGGGDA